MRCFKFYLIFWMILINYSYLFAKNIEIKVILQNEIITNIDIINESKYLLFLNPKLSELSDKKIKDIAKNSLITDIIKKKEIEKFYNLERNNNLVNKIEKNFLDKKNINSKSELIEILNNIGLSYDAIKEKIVIEAFWNQLVYKKFSNNIKINKEYLRKNILSQFKTDKTKYEYNLSEIFFTETINESLNETLVKLNQSIKNIGFENSANIFSKSNTAKNGGIIGWVNELQFSENIKKNILNLSKNEISEPIKIEGGYLLIKLNDKREFNQKINIDNQLKELVKLEKNRQLNAFSIIYYKRLKKNIQINEL